MFNFFDPPPERELFDAILSESEKLIENGVSLRRVVLHLINFTVAAGSLVLSEAELEQAIQFALERERNDSRKGGPGDRLAAVFTRGQSKP